MQVTGQLPRGRRPARHHGRQRSPARRAPRSRTARPSAAPGSRWPASSILGGVVTIDSLVTDLVAAHDGKTGSTAGGTTATGVKFLGLDAVADRGRGLVLDEAPPVTGPGAPLGAIARPRHRPAARSHRARAGPARPGARRRPSRRSTTLLAAAGIELRLLDPEDAAERGGAARRPRPGCRSRSPTRAGSRQALVDLINSIPAELSPAIGPIPNPVTFLAENHVTG